MKNTEYSLFLDMDGVLVDFSGGYWKLIGVDRVVNTPEAEKRARDKYLNAGSKFWATLPWAQGGRQLWESAKNLFERVHILSSIGTTNPDRGKVVIDGKLEWLANNMPDMPKENVFLVERKFFKKDYAAHDRILVDDVKGTIQEWNAAGGYGILHWASRYRKTIYELEDLATPLELVEILKHIRH